MSRLPTLIDGKNINTDEIYRKYKDKFHVHSIEDFIKKAESIFEYEKKLVKFKNMMISWRWMFS
jgi:hypothetical protein